MRSLAGGADGLRCRRVPRVPRAAHPRSLRERSPLPCDVHRGPGHGRDDRRLGAAAVTLSLEVRIGSLLLRNPVLVASGIIGYGTEYARLVDLSSIGGIVTKTV